MPGGENAGRCATVRVSRSFAASVADAEAHWYDTARWPEWVDGLERVVAVDGRLAARGRERDLAVGTGRPRAA